MDTEEAIDVYRKMAKDVFSPRFLGFSLHKLGYLGYVIGNPYLRFKSFLFPSSYSDYCLREAIDKVMAMKEETGEAKLRKHGTPRMFVCATSIEHERAELFRSYKPPSDVKDEFEGITAKEAALATSAAPTYLPTVKVMNKNFWDGGLLNNNPINQVWDAKYDLVPVGEGEGIPDPPQVSCVVSIGTGRVKKPVQQLGWRFFNTVSTIMSYATNTEAKHQDFERKIGRLNKRRKEDIRYWRFDVELDKPIKLDDWQSMQKLEKITQDQLTDEDRRITACANHLV